MKRKMTTKDWIYYQLSMLFAASCIWIAGLFVLHYIEVL